MSTIGYYICVPFAWLVRLFYDLTNSYGVALILFTLFIKLIMLPFQMKSKKSMMRMRREVYLQSVFCDESFAAWSMQKLLDYYGGLRFCHYLYPDELRRAEGRCHSYAGWREGVCQHY